MPPLGVGIIGAGAATQAIHLPTLALLPDRLRVSHIFDVDEAAASTIADRAGARFGTSLDAFFDDPEVEIVAICSPHQYHAEQVEAACAAGKKAVLCEKPLAISVAEGDRIAAASENSGVPIIVGTMHAWDPAWRALAGAWGDLAATVRTIRSTIYLPSNGDMTDLATNLFTPSLVATSSTPGSRSALDAEVLTIRDGVLGLAMHAMPLIREFLPDVGEVRHARALTPWGYSICCGDDRSSVTLNAIIGGSWAPQWTLEAWGASKEACVTFPPSYVSAGSAVAEIRSASDRKVWHFDTNGYLAEWTHVADVVEGRCELAIPLETAIEDLVQTVLLTEAAVNHRRSSTASFA
jgi:myo-inositol 2-dehydrogenase / D-chiro-inositol 1-dehydrogenase